MQTGCVAAQNARVGTTQTKLSNVNGAQKVTSARSNACGAFFNVVVVLNSCVSKRPFIANKKVTFANLSRIHRRALFIAQFRKTQLLSASVVRREIRFPDSSCKVAAFHHKGST